MSQIGRRGRSSRAAEAASKSQSQNEAGASSRPASQMFKNSQEFYSQNLVDKNENVDGTANGEEDPDISFMGEINIDPNNFLQQDPHVRRELRMKYRELLEAAHKGREDGEQGANAEISAEEFRGMLDKMDELYDQVQMPREAAYDTELLQTLTGINRMQVRALVTQFHKFEPIMFAFKLANFLHGRPVETEPTPDADSENRISVEEEEEDGDSRDFEIGGEDDDQPGPSSQAPKGAATKRTLNRLQRYQIQQQKKIIQRKPRDPKQAGPAAVLKKVDQEEESQELEHTAYAVKLVYFSLVAYTGTLDKHEEVDLITDAIPFYKFVIDPKSFTKTVENMFHVSFLIKDGYARISLDKNQLPTIEVTKKKRKQCKRSIESDQERTVTYQQVLELTEKQYKELIEVFNIREAMIPHKEALNRFDKRKSAVAASSLSQASQSSQRTQQRQNLSAIEEKNAVSLDDQEQSDEEEVLPASKKRKRTGRR